MFKVGDIVKVKNKAVTVFGFGPLVVSAVDEYWISIEGFPQTGGFTYRETVFELVQPMSLENK